MQYCEIGRDVRSPSVVPFKMMTNRYRASSRRCSIQYNTKHRSTKRRQNHTPNPPVMSNIQGMRGKMSSNCLWHACQALVVGIVLFSIGAAMSTLGFHADGLLDPNNNTTVASRTYDYNDSPTTIRFSKLSYAGPIVMGVGGFIIVATCVMTFEARDSAAKVGPASYSGTRTASALYANTYRARTRSLDMRSVGSQTMAESTTTSNTGLHIFDKKALFDTFKKFSRTIRTVSTSKEDQFHRSPSAPNLLASDVQNERATQVSITGSRRASVLPKAKNRVPPALKYLRQTMSVDCPSSSPFISHTATISTNASTFPTASVMAGSSHCITSSSGLVASSQTKAPGTLISSTSHSNPGQIMSYSTTNANSNYSQSQMGIGKSRSKGISTAGSSLVNSTDKDTHFYSISDGGASSRTSQTNLVPSAEPHCSHQTLMQGSQVIGHAHHPGFKPTSLSHNPNVHFEPATVELHLPNGLVTLHLCPSASSSIEALSSSPTSLRLSSPQPQSSQRMEPENLSSSLERSSVKSDGVSRYKSSVTGGAGSRPKLRSELSCRPTLMRQPRVVDQSEIISVPDSDDEPILEEDFEGEV